MGTVLLYGHIKVLQGLKICFLGVDETLLVVHQFVNKLAVRLNFVWVFAQLLVRVVRFTLL